MILRFLLPSIFLCGNLLGGALAAKTQTATKDGGATGTRTVSLPHRERNLDFMDAATLAYYLGLDARTGERLREPPAASETTHNVAVMFYAQWDRNSHALAPAWDNIGRTLKAGTKKSNLILALFDCELDSQHLNLCHGAGVTHYPTILFISPARTFPHKPHVPHSKTKAALPHTKQFPGPWQYDKCILDWLKTMQMMTGWTNFWAKSGTPRGWWQAAASHDPNAAKFLPVGIPGGGSSGNNPATAELTAALEEATADRELYQDLTLRGATMLDAVLFPVVNPQNLSSTDVYAQLSPGGWNATDVANRVLRACAMEVALDYCIRLTTHKTNELVNAKTTAGGTDQTLAQLEAELGTMIGQAEPYCSLVEECVVDGFATEACRPNTCPFQAEAACRYLSTCFDESMQQDYAKALGVEVTPKAGGQQESTKKKRGWF